MIDVFYVILSNVEGYKEMFRLTRGHNKGNGVDMIRKSRPLGGRGTTLVAEGESKVQPTIAPKILYFI